MIADCQSSRRISMLIWCLALIAVLSLLWPVYRAFLNISIDPNEGWNAYFADAAMGRMPLYPSSDQLITNNYPPLSFYIVGAFGWLIDDMVLAGRLLSLTALLLSALAIALAIRRLGGGAIAAGIGAFYLMATMSRFFSNYVGMNDPQLFAQAVMAFGFVLFLRAIELDRGYALPIIVMVTAGFIKHNIIAMPLTAMIWLGIHRPRQVVNSGLLAMCAIAAGFALCYAVFGPNFFAGMMSPRAILWRRASGVIGHLQWISVGLIAWLYVGIMRRADPRVQLCSLLIGIALLTSFVEKTGAGVGENAVFDLVFAVSIGIGLAFAQAPFLSLAQRCSPEAVQFTLLLAICLRLVASTRLEPVKLFVDPGFHAEIAHQEAEMSASVARIKSIPGNVLGPSLLASFKAGKPFIIDHFNVDQRIKAGKLLADTVSKLVESGNFTIIEPDRLITKEHKPLRDPR